MTVKTLLRKLKAASNEVESMKVPFEELSSVLDASKLRLWTQEAEKADNERGEALDIYNLKMEKGWFAFFSKCSCLSFLPSLIAPTLAEMRDNLLHIKALTSGLQGSVTWLVEGISIEDAQ